jgi:aspartyl-tRNA(Asn)/glutamyl-tRNA(Gln) amidotransferase subunit A
VEAYYRQARKVQTLIRQGYAEAFKNVDLLVMPTAPTTAYRLGEKTTDPLEMYLGDIFTVAVNVAGLPAIALPCGSRAALPVGMQLIGAYGSDDQLLAYAREIEPLISL